MKWHEPGSQGVDKIRDAMCLAKTHGLPHTNIEQAEYGCRIQKSDRDNAMKLVFNMEASEIQKIMDKAPEPLDVWLDFAYGDNGSLGLKDKRRYIIYLVGRKFINHKYGKKRQGTLKKLLEFVIDEHRRRVSGQKAFSAAIVQGYMGFGYRDWTNWRKLYTGAHDWLSEVDQLAMDYFIGHAPRFLR